MIGIFNDTFRCVVYSMPIFIKVNLFRFFRTAYMVLLSVYCISLINAPYFFKY